MSIRARIFIVFAAAVIAGFSLLAYWISSDVSDRYSESFEEVMVDSAHLMAEVISSDINSGDKQYQQLDDAFKRLKLRQFSAQIYDLEKTHADIRIYVTDDTGQVVFDSDNGNAVGEDYSQWLDVARTLKGEYGARATRVRGEKSSGDPSQQLTIAYVAAPIYQQGRIIGVVSLAKPKDNIDRFVADAKANFFKAVALSIAVALLLGLMLYIWVSRPLQTLVNYANAIGRGERAKLPPLGNNEIGEVGTAIDDMRKALENKQYVERYVQSVTHEIKSPLTAIQSSAELLARDLPLDKRQQFADTILKETNRLNDFTSQLLQLAALENTQSLESPTTIVLNDVIKDVIQAHQLEYQAKHTNIDCNFSGDITIEGDAFLIRQAIDNLFRNALDFSPNESLITLKLHQDNGQAIIDIIDQGPGIPEYALERIFDRFYSLPRPDTGQKSSGLGLNFSREVAELHRGSLSLTNLSPGTCAKLLLPLHSE